MRSAFAKLDADHAVAEAVAGLKLVKHKTAQDASLGLHYFELLLFETNAVLPAIGMSLFYPLTWCPQL